MEIKERAALAKKMKLYPDKCTGCLQCLMACSLKYEGEVNPRKARTKIMRKDMVEKITLTPECTFCGHCVTVCFYGARVLEESE